MLSKDDSEVLEIPTMWRTLLAVCSQWRHLALASPRFSATIVLSDTHNLESMLKYSMKAPIRLYYPLSDIYSNGMEDIDRAGAALSVVLGEPQSAERLEQLVITCGQPSSGALNEFFRILGVYGAQSLQEMSLIHKGSHNRGAYFHPHTLPWKGIPALRRLELENILVPLDMPLLPYLTKLTLATHNLSGHNGIPISYAAEFLRRTPNVEIINVSHVVEDWAPNPFSSGDDGALEVPIALAKLRSFTVHSNPINGCDLLKRVNIPHSARVEAFFTDKVKNSTVDTEEKRLSARTALISFFSTIVAPSSSPKISVSFGFGGSTYALLVHCGLSPSRRKISISNQHDFLDLGDFVDILESSQITSRAFKLTVFNEKPSNVVLNKEEGGGLSIVGGTKRLEEMDVGLWSRILPLFKSVKALFVENTKLWFLTAILKPSPSSELPPLEDRNASLQHIRLISVECRCPRAIYPVAARHDSAIDDKAEHPLRSPISDEDGKEGGSVDQKLEEDPTRDKENVKADIKDLVRILKTRKAAGLPRIQLVLLRCGITSRQIEFLRKGGLEDLGDVMLRRCDGTFGRRFYPFLGRLKAFSNTTLPFLTAILRPSSVVNPSQETGQTMVSVSMGNSHPSLRHVTLISVKCDSPVVSRVENLHYAATLPFANEAGMEGDAEQDLVKATIEDEEDIGVDLMDLVTLLKIRQAAGLPRIRFTLERSRECRITPRQIQFLSEHAEVEVQNPIPWAGFTNISSI
ncbi:hypothetical protein ONZ45_g12228 [Pleurotus djamor]|nr:hypothetical protein ONZ45_g12228 [Pleurotus djamor]